MSMSVCRLVLLLAALGAISFPAGAADLRVQVDRQRLDSGDVLEMQFSAEGELDGEPDFAPLEQDFDILGRGQSQVTSIVNGKISHRRQWNLRLAPKRVGRLTIPSLTAGKDRSDPVTVEVVEAGSGSADEGPKPLFVEAEVESASPYVQQPIEYRVKVYYRRPPQRAVLSEPLAEGAIIQQSGEDRGYDESRDSLLYRVIERRYRVTPQRSGQILIQSPRLEAMIEDPNQGPRRDPFADLDQAFGGRIFQGFPSLPGNTHPGRRVVERAGDLALQVKPQPPGSPTPWLPATSVQLTDEWTPSPPLFRVGEPLTRTLTITAEGTTAAQLPNLDPGPITGTQVYPDQPRGEDLADGTVPSAIKRLKIALVPTRPGALTLPEIRLHWWDTVIDSQRVAVIPARTVEVLPASGGEVRPPDAAPIPSVPALESAASREPPRESAGGGADGAGGRGGFWPWLTLALALGWGVSLLWWRRQRRQVDAPVASVREAPERDQAQPRGALEAARRSAEAACLSGDPRAARAALLAWARVRWPDQAPAGLDALGARMGQEGCAQALRALDRAVYAPPGESWDGRAAWERLSPCLARGSEHASEQADPIPDLYPRD